jgi:catechol 2,3-dioxygenase-like lactoylglutathione lyase family enzyme
MSTLEHVNFTVSDPKRTARMFEQIFGWHIRWEGDAMAGAGYSSHVGSNDSYVALYAGVNPEQTVPKAGASYVTRGAMNHIGIVVEDLNLVEEKVRAMGYEPHKHADYEPGRRFYFSDDDGIDIEVIRYV